MLIRKWHTLIRRCIEFGPPEELPGFGSEGRRYFPAVLSSASVRKLKTHPHHHIDILTSPSLSLILTFILILTLSLILSLILTLTLLLILTLTFTLSPSLLLILTLILTPSPSLLLILTLILTPRPGSTTPRCNSPAQPGLQLTHSSQCKAEEENRFYDSDILHQFGLQKEAFVSWR
ncbi:hypothetical protein AAES_71137 [Amazona aestiva]|uniref:Uncharacterized protein n=1 Tax=Amazona aestiva TaxID=12930 RepID=A0A0Q3MIX8_AMAAE|nr:hypothetical protein AAES_71137 [Amazona aestiva]